LVLCGYRDINLTTLPAYIERAAAALGFDIPANQPVVGQDAFRTATGVHAAALLKAKQRADGWLADHVYSSVPAALVGRKQHIEIGPMSGEANVSAWLAERGMTVDMDLVRALLDAAKRSDRVLTDHELDVCIQNYERRRSIEAASAP
jgi:2-isopropylmalate synthase